MKDKHTVNLILISSKWLISFSGACSSYHILGSKLFILFSGAPSYFNYIISKLHLIHRRPWILFFSSFTSHAFITGVFMVVHHVLIHPWSLHQDSCWSSSIFIMLSNCNPFYLIFSDGVMSFLTIPSCFMIHKFSRMRYFNPSFFFVQEIFSTLQFIRWSYLGLYLT